MREDRACRLVADAIDDCLGSGETKVEVTLPITRKLNEEVLRIGASGTVLLVQRWGFGPAFERTCLNARFAVDLSASTDDIVKAAISGCRLLIQDQTERKARAACAGLERPMEREEFIDFRRLQIDYAGARALQHAFQSDEQIRDWLRERLGRAFDRKIASHFYVSDFTVCVPFKLNPLRLHPDDGTSSREDYWCGPAIHLNFLNMVDRTLAARRLEEVQYRTALQGRTIIDLKTYPSYKLAAAINRRQGLYDASDFFPPVRSRQWQARLVEKLISVDQAFG